MNTNAEVVMHPAEAGYAKVVDARRAGALMGAHGRKAVEFEVQVFTLAGKMLEGYTGGLWDIYEVADELETAVFMALPEPSRQRVTSPNGSSHVLSALDAGLVLAVFANNWLAHHYAKRDEAACERFMSQYELLHAFARSRPAADQIFALLD